MQVEVQDDATALAARTLGGSSGGALLETACAAAGLELVRSRLRSVHHRTGRSVSHVHEATIHLGAPGVQPAARDVLLVAHVDLRGHPEGAFVLTTGRDEVAVWRFPHDPYLPGLASAVDPTRVRELLDRLGGPPGTIGLHTRAYRPARRAVVEVTVDGPDATGRVLYLKVLSGRRAEALATVHEQLTSHVPVPRVFGVAREQGILVVEALAGPTLRAAVVDGRPLPEPAALVELSQRLAGSGLVSDRNPRGFADPLRHVPGLADLVPDRAGTLAMVAQEAARVDGEAVPVHGDLHDGQLLVAGSAVTGLLDVDGAGVGLLAHDAGSLVAHLAAIGRVWPDVTDRAERYAAAVADAYRPLVGADALRRAVAGAWVGLATGPHRAQDEGWQDETRWRIDRAAAELAG